MTTMIQIPLQYSNKIFHHAQIDDDAEPIKNLGYFSVTIPKPLRRLAHRRPDIILAFLQEDPETVHKCKPFVSLFGTQLLLVHLVARRTLVNLIFNTLHMVNNKASLHTTWCMGSTPIVRSEINQIRGSIGRMVYADGDATNCTRENLREM